ncbi:MAG: hypothetical protein ACRCWR_08940, partial [Saezia sp.]
AILTRQGLSVLQCFECLFKIEGSFHLSFLFYLHKFKVYDTEFLTLSAYRLEMALLFLLLIYWNCFVPAQNLLIA